jgi:hypothetical protein
MSQHRFYVVTGEPEMLRDCNQNIVLPGTLLQVSYLDALAVLVTGEGIAPYNRLFRDIQASCVPAVSCVWVDAAGRPANFKTSKLFFATHTPDLSRLKEPVHENNE